MSAFRRYAVATSLAGLMSVAACGTTPAGQPGAAKSPGPAISTPAPATTTPAPRATTPAPSGIARVPRQPTLRLGSLGSAVVRLQQRLAVLHYFDVATADGVFEQNTYHAVIAFQKVQGLTRDGVVGPATWARLAAPYVPVPRYPMPTASLEVNLAKQVIYYVRNGAIERIIDSSTGSGTWYYSQGRRAQAITPTGRFRIYSRYDGWQAGPLGSLYRPNYFYGGYAVHGMTSVPANPASHGCVRMTVPTMDRMWSSLRVGMPVAIYNS
jgi:peptidoglycan hydrolase-like protein with peptidoglycan-binding domain